jgi:hypothetical protein
MPTRRLIATWLVLLALIALAGLFARVDTTALPGALGLAALAVVTVAKARLVLSRYLHLEIAPDFLFGFTAAVAAIVGIVTLSVASGLEIPRAGAPIACSTPAKKKDDGGSNVVNRRADQPRAAVRCR